MEYGIKVVTGQVKDDSLFVFISRADQDEKGNVDYLNPLQHQKANPSYGVTIRPSDMMQAAIEAQNAQIYEIDVERTKSPASAIFILQMSRSNSSHSGMLSAVAELGCVRSVQELIS
jgi:hypothetical protein